MIAEFLSPLSPSGMAFLEARSSTGPGALSDKPQLEIRDTVAMRRNARRIHHLASITSAVHLEDEFVVEICTLLAESSRKILTIGWRSPDMLADEYRAMIALLVDLTEELEP